HVATLARAWESYENRPRSGELGYVRSDNIPPDALQTTRPSATGDSTWQLLSARSNSHNRASRALAKARSGRQRSRQPPRNWASRSRIFSGPWARTTV